MFQKKLDLHKDKSSYPECSFEYFREIKTTSINQYQDFQQKQAAKGPLYKQGVSFELWEDLPKAFLCNPWQESQAVVHGLSSVYCCFRVLSSLVAQPGGHLQNTCYVTSDSRT